MIEVSFSIRSVKRVGGTYKVDYQHYFYHTLRRYLRIMMITRCHLEHEPDAILRHVTTNEKMSPKKWSSKLTKK